MGETGRRAISTVFDVTLCLLLVSASAFVLVGAQSSRQAMTNEEPTGKEPTAESTANVLVTSTAAVNYTIRTEQKSLSRKNHGTLAGLLTEAAIANTTVHGSKLMRESENFETTVARRVRNQVGITNGTNTQVVVRWQPYRDAHIRGETAVGNSPPRDATVHAASVSVPSGLPGVRDDTLDAARQDGYRGVARVVATGIVSGLLPEHSTNLALHDRPPVADSAAGRFQRLGEQYYTDLPSGANDGNGIGTRQTLVRAITATIETELRKTFESPAEAAQSVSVGRAEIVVRTWSA
ncbi:hypothetical protein SAMN05421858_0795 [Haladaptatus litoreus]|uniref:Uncharacterized protein n=1 Tax=Haladaptatus litoreus TaxID=553468 RepID=A0A1N6WMR2_9EURY|nr:hypothetical protein [Haladaptatus litoreus]SIQ91394.1 hypothetical protein SAMN05421858_0795 [Haladaptatus litoreus]